MLADLSKHAWITGPIRFSRHVLKTIYSDPPNTGPSGIRMVIFGTLEIRFSNVFFKMAANYGSHFVKTI
jgi:hypothetical protein